jgi:hypothetical protein
VVGKAIENAKEKRMTRFQDTSDDDEEALNLKLELEQEALKQ